MLEQATLRGQEYSWRIEDFPHILDEAVKHELACQGGVFQFRLPNGTCEMYWLETGVSDQQVSQSWHDYVLYCAEKTAHDFKRICEQTDFRRAAKDWDKVWRELPEPDVDPLDYLCFVAYFADAGGNWS